MLPQRSKPPKYLPDDARALWPHLVDELAARGTLSRVAVHRLAIYCQLFAQFHRVTVWINQHGQTAPTYYPQTDEETGKQLVKEVKVAPEAKQQATLVEALRKFDKEFGFLENIKAEDPLEALRQKLNARMAAGTPAHN